MMPQAPAAVLSQGLSADADGGEDIPIMASPVLQPGDVVRPPADTTQS
jgi:hypothetical protein